MSALQQLRQDIEDDKRYKAMWDSLYKAFPKKGKENKIMQSTSDFKIGDKVVWDEPAYHLTFKGMEDTTHCSIQYGIVSNVTPISITFKLKQGCQKIHYKKLFCVKKIEN